VNFEQARDIHKAGDLSRALNAYFAILRKQKNNPEVLHSIGVVYTQQKNYKEALKFLESAASLKQDDPTIQLHLANSYKLAKRYDKAEKILSLTIEKFNNYPPAFNNLGTVYFLQGKNNEAINAYKKALEIYPQYVDAYYNLALTLSKSNLLSEAKENYKKLLNIDPTHFAAQFHLACLLMQQQNYKDAAEEFLKIELANPHHFETQTNIATCFLKQGKLEKSKEHYQKAFELDETDTQILFNLGVINTQLGNLDSAIQSYQKAIAIMPKSFEIHNNLGVAFLAKRHNTLALKHFEKALEIDPTNKAIKYTIEILSQNKTLLKAPDDYIKSLFDSYADHYDTHLLSALDYTLPNTFLDILKNKIKKNLNILDLGCGTGLCGEKFKPFAKNLVGVDLSPKMLEFASQKQIYDSLIPSDLESFLQDNLEKFDLIILGDVLVYTGDIDNIFKLLNLSLAKGGLVIFNTEITNAANFEMNQSGRFSHKQSYIESLAQNHNLKIKLYKETITRMQNNEPCHGHLHVLEKL